MKEKNTSFHCPWVKKIHHAVVHALPEPIVIQGPPHPEETKKLFNRFSAASLAQVPSLIINTQLKQQSYYPTILSPLTVGCAVKGRMALEKSNKRLILNHKNYRIMNHGNYVTEAIEKSEALRICFNGHFAADVFSSLVSPADRLLDNPDPSSQTKIWFFEKTHHHDQMVSPLLWKIREAIQQQETNIHFLEEGLHQLLESLLFVHRNIAEEIQHIPAIKKSTRIELYQRVHHAREYIEDQLSSPLRLENIAKAAALSKHHFLRLFKQLLGETPYRYIQRRRLEEFRELLLSENISITGACYQVGFSDLSDCSRLFKREYGLSPRKFRETKHKNISNKHT